MTRLYIQPSFINSCEEHGLWSGGNDQYRGDRSVDVATFDSKGRARMEAFSDSAIESLKKRKTSIPLADRILPQAKRVRLLTEQLYELEAERKNGMDIHTYTQLRNILICKRSRVEELLKKATSVQPKSYDEDFIDPFDAHPDYTEDFTYTNDDSSTPSAPVASDIGVRFIDDLSCTNSLKGVLKKACTTYRMLVEFKHKVKAYYQILKEV